jgi:ATP-dependent Clp protease adaptor protein ClpS.
MTEKPVEVIDIKDDTSSIIGHPYNVIIFNDEAHAMDEVVYQIIKATHCGRGRAVAIMAEAHKTGRSIVYTGGLERCEHVEAVLAEIKLGTKIEPA